MSVAENLAVVRRFYGAGPADDDRDRRGYAADDIVWHVPGANRVSGTYYGAEQVFDAMPALMQPLDRWELDLVDVMGNGDFVVATVEVRGTRYGRSVETRGAHLFRLDAAGLILEAWGFTVDQAGLDALLDPA